MKKKSLLILAALVLVVAAGVGFYFLRPGGGNGVSTGPKKVIEAMMTCPNDDLFTEDMVSVIGVGVTPDPEKLEEAMEDWDDAREEWNEEVGKYFAPNCLDSFLNDSVAYSYLVKGVPVKVEKMELLERQKEPIVIAIENMETGSGICAAEDLMEIADALHPCAGICLDTGHAHIAGEDIPAFINRTGSLLIGTHIADNNGKEDQHLLPGFGTIRWEDVMKAFRTSGYRGFLNFECMFFSRNMPQLLSSEIARLSLMIGDWLLSL